MPSASAVQDANRLAFLEHCWPGNVISCPRCVERSVYHLKDGRYRCAGCGYTFHDFSGRWINRCHLTPAQWKALVRLFIEGIPVVNIAEEVEASYETALKAMHVLRLSILADDQAFLRLLNGRGELRKHCRAGRRDGKAHCLGDQAPVFALKKEEKRISFRLLDGVHVREIATSPLRKRVWRTMVFTDKTGEYDALFFACCRHLREGFRGVWGRECVALDGDLDFWKFAEKWLAPYRCFTPECCPLYLKELEFRRNYPQHEWFSRLTKGLCRFVP